MSGKPITSFTELAQHQATEALQNRKAIIITGGQVHIADKSHVDGVELGGRVADEWEDE